MQNRTLICKVNMFDNDQTVVFEDGTSEKVPMSQIYAYLPAACYSKGYNKIHFFGDANFIEGIVSMVRSDEVTLFHRRELEIEVN